MVYIHKERLAMENPEKREKTGILIVEDSPTQAKILQHTLEKHNFEVYKTKNGKEALEYLNDHEPALIISDIIMPEMNGYEFCKEVKSNQRLRAIPIILLTMLSEPEDVIKGLESGADNFMTKPYDEQALMARIHYVLNNAELRESRTSEMGIEIAFAGKKHLITSNRIQILDLLISTYENAIQKTRELEKTVRELTHAHETIKTLKGLIPICANCKKVRNDAGFWEQIEMYIRDHSEAEFTHGFCPDCMQKLYPKRTK
jgi:two-component system, OmpR family, response regulator VanR